jgi:hypothetical protein
MHRRRVVGDRITYVGLDVHKEGIVVAVAEEGIRGEVRKYGRIANTATALDRVARKLGREAVRLRFCYEDLPDTEHRDEPAEAVGRPHHCMFGIRVHLGPAVSTAAIILHYHSVRRIASASS